ncbi:Protein kinase-like domain protein [Niveomyces insectorum RCEF 264]|uniref:EKC/KEOPS complex subunit BUD32 n=1 Tax=Niveomyces insectorum RCEF 264 TaxID=1081102 RepID=A0A167T9I6_9HYPO|nr:Protein kinase-like domain protein [Niveomyces insectorum RCEF 264]
MAGMMWLVEDWDQRKTIRVYAPTRREEPDFILEALAKFIDDLPADAILVTISETGALISSTSDIAEDISTVPFYFSLADFPAGVATVRRRDLTEIDRLGLMVDLTTYQSSTNEPKKAVFKYFVNVGNRAGFWYEANCVLRMPAHDNIVPFDALVVDTVDGDDKVVGFLTRYVPGGTLHENKDRVFKLKYLEQLIQTVDFLNLQLGIVHGDICPWNLLIDADADAIQLFDFNSGAKLGWEGDEEHGLVFGYDKDRNDVKFVVYTLYEIITRAFSFRSEFYPNELDAAGLLKKKTWKIDPDVQLDHPVAAYRRILADWVERRKTTDKSVRHFSQAAEPLDCPPVPKAPTHDRIGQPLDRPAQYRIILLEMAATFYAGSVHPHATCLCPKASGFLPRERL